MRLTKDQCTNALTKEQIENNIEEILPDYRLIEKSLYEQLTAKKAGKALLDVDFSHRILYCTAGGTVEKELIQTLIFAWRELTGLFGVMIQLLQTTEENKLCASIATCIAEEINSFGLLLDVDWQKPFENGEIEKLNASLQQLDKMHKVLTEALGENEKGQFGCDLAMTVDQKLLDIRSLLAAYTEKNKESGETEQAEEGALKSVR
jgi:hypothetical protein